jgi:hypothetical protein
LPLDIAGITPKIAVTREDILESIKESRLNYD